jgi:hypothetical protein
MSRRVLHDRSGSDVLNRLTEEDVGKTAALDGTHAVSRWQAARAAMSSPGMFAPLSLDLSKDAVRVAVDLSSVVDLYDCGLFANNPTQIAIGEAKLLYPNRAVGAVVSIGGGKLVTQNNASDLKAGFTTQSLAANSERIHREVGDRWMYKDDPTVKYIRFNPKLSNAYEFDTSEVDDIKKLLHDGSEYVKYAEADLNRVADVLIEMGMRLCCVPLLHELNMPFL